MDELLTASEAVAFLKLKSAITLRRWRKAGRLPVVRLTGGTIRYRRSDLEALTAASVRWEGDAAPTQHEPTPIKAAPSWLDRNAINPITRLPYGQAGSAAR